MLVSEDEVRAVPAVPFTKTWHPHHHGVIMDHAEAALTESGIEIVNKNFELSLNGLDLFTSWQLQGNDERAWELGFRNSMQKRFPLGIVAGSRVMCCENLCLSGNWLEVLKHTSGLDDERLAQVFGEAVHSMFSRLVEFESWTISLKSQLVLPGDVKILTYDSMVGGVFAPSKFSAFQEAYAEETKENRVETLYNFQGAVTRLLRGETLFQIQRRTAALETILRNFQESREGGDIIEV